MFYKMVENDNPLSLAELEKEFSEVIQLDERRDSLVFLIEQVGDPAFSQDFYRLLAELEESKKPNSEEITLRGIFYLAEAIAYDKRITLERAIEDLEAGNHRDWIAVCAQEILNRISDSHFSRDTSDREKLPDILVWCQKKLRGAK